jgi:hypothetical protein
MPSQQKKLPLPSPPFLTMKLLLPLLLAISLAVTTAGYCSWLGCNNQLALTPSVPHEDYILIDRTYYQDPVDLAGSNRHVVPFTVPSLSGPFGQDEFEEVLVTHELYSNSSGGAHNAVITDLPTYWESRTTGRYVYTIATRFGWWNSYFTLSERLLPGDYYLIFFTDYWTQSVDCDRSVKMLLHCGGRSQSRHLHHQYITLNYRLIVSFSKQNQG